ncbi:serine protease [Kibdelosporangium lantanae]
MLYTDVTKHVDWINGIMSGNVPPLDRIPDVSGSALLPGCVGSVVRTPTARPTDPALLLTNGHCLGDRRPKPGQALVDRPADLDVDITDNIGYPMTTEHASRLVYATMTGTDIAIYRLDRTYAQLTAKVHDLTTRPMKAGDRVDMLAGSARGACTVEAVVPHLREGGYQEDNSVRYATSDACEHLHGYSGSALLSGNTVVGIHNTGNDSGEQCTDDNPCEVAADGTVTSTRGRGYGQQVDQIAACFTGSRLDLNRYGCSLRR